MTSPETADTHSTEGAEEAAHDALQSAMSALARLKALGIAPLPEYYTVFFHYYEGGPAGLAQAVDASLRTAGDDAYRLSDYLMRIHESFFGLGRRQELLDAAAENIGTEVDRLAGMIDQANKATRSYGAALGSFSSELLTQPPPDRIKAAASRMASETQTVIDTNQKLKGDLDSALAQVSELRQSLDTVKRETLIDALTGIGNRKAFVTGFLTLAEEAVQRGESLALVMADIDLFKRFNDTYGHRVGDQILKLVARTLKDNVKGRDVVARYGGEEFALLLPRTSLADALKVAENLRRMIASKKIVRRNDGRDLGTVTLSLGVTEFARGEDEASFVARADKALYMAKEKGRNRVVASDLPATAKADKQQPSEAKSYADEVIVVESQSHDGAPAAPAREGQGRGS